MHSLKADEAMIRCKEKVSIGTSQTRERIKDDTIYGYENRGRKARLGEELDPIDIVVIRHVLLNYPTPPNDSHLYTWGIVTEVSLRGYQQTTRQWREQHGRGINEYEWSAQGTPQNHIQVDDMINITKGTPLGSLGINLLKYTHHHGALCNFLSTIHAKMIIPIRADPTRPIHAYP
jgi:hypothetical protein